MSSQSKSKSADGRTSRILEALNFTIPVEQADRSYKTSIGALGLVLCVLWMAYIALVLFLLWLVGWHLYQSLVTFKDGPYFLFHGPMLVLGAVLLAVMIKPILFPNRGEDEQTERIDASRAPQLYEFVHRLCDATGKPRPSYIEVDCVPNAAARFEKGLRSILNGQFVLRLGLPLLATMSAQQLAGVIGHELAHFSQRGGLTGSHLVRAITLLLAKIIFVRDRIDERLHRLRSGNLISKAVYWIAFGLAEAARGVMWIMLLIGDLMCKRALRKMEFAADRLETQIGGSKSFVETSKLLALLGIANRGTEHDLAATWEDRRLPDDMAALTAFNLGRLEKHRQEIIDLLSTQKTQWFDTHPSYADRTRAAEQMECDGAYQCNLPASLLIPNFTDLCRQVSQKYYRRVLGPQIEGAKLVPSTRIISQRERDRDAANSLERFFHGSWSWLRPVVPYADWHSPLSNAGAASENILETRQSMRTLAATLAGAGEKQAQATVATLIFRAQGSAMRLFPGSPEATRLLHQANQELKENQAVAAQAEVDLARFEKPARMRLTIALRLLHSPSCDLADVDNLRFRVASCMDVIERLYPHADALRKLHETAVSLRVMGEMFNPQQPVWQLESRILDLLKLAREQLQALQPALGEIAYPYEHAVANSSVGSVLIEMIPMDNDPVLVHNVAMEAVERHTILIVRLVAELTQIAEQIEAHLGLPADDVAETPEEKHKVATEAIQEKTEARRYWTGYGVRAAAGIALVIGLIWYSVDPPVLPAMAWSGGQSGGYSLNYRPAGFSGGRQSQRNASPVVYTPEQGYRPVIITGQGPQVMMPSAHPGRAVFGRDPTSQGRMIDARQFMPQTERNRSQPGGPPGFHNPRPGFPAPTPGLGGPNRFQPHQPGGMPRHVPGGTNPGGPQPGAPPAR